MIREARKRKSSNNCWINDGPGKRIAHRHVTYWICQLNEVKTMMVGKGWILAGKELLRRQNHTKYSTDFYSYHCTLTLPRCSFSLPHRESKVFMRRRCPARRMLSASLVSISELQLGSKLSSQEISSSSMVAALTFNTSISEATEQAGEQTEYRRNNEY